MKNNVITIKVSHESALQDDKKKELINKQIYLSKEPIALKMFLLETHLNTCSHLNTQWYLNSEYPQKTFKIKFRNEMKRKFQKLQTKSHEIEFVNTLPLLGFKNSHD